MSIDKLTLIFEFVAGGFVFNTLINILFEKRFDRNFNLIVSIKKNTIQSFGIMLWIFLLAVSGGSAFGAVYFLVKYLIK